jgi:2-polyprenyl-3-methyl-5-hydroxy-6-metoxy-1,4-benzoquinol methylase
MHGFFIFQQYTKFAGLELIEKNKCLKNKTSEYKSRTTKRSLVQFFTPYYHILYKERNYTEAQFFMDNITNYLNLPENAKVLDLACGKGRHSTYLNQLGFDVLGADLSENSMKLAKTQMTPCILKFMTCEF